MPIRFHCPPCGQLLGIARRKAGTQVQCPSCRAWVLVPTKSEAVPIQEQQAQPQHIPASPPTQPVKHDAEPLFDRVNFEELLHGSTAANPVGLPPLPYSPPGAFASQSFDVEPIPAEPARSTSRPLVLAVLIVLLMAFSFGVGILVGRYLL